jgi:hypothetical protein
MKTKKIQKQREQEAPFDIVVLSWIMNFIAMKPRS